MIKVVEAVEGLLLATVQRKLPAMNPGRVRVWVYLAVTGSFNTVSVPSVIVTESLVQVTVVAGPPVEIQAMVCVFESKVKLYIVISPPIKISASMLRVSLCQKALYDMDCTVTELFRAPLL